MNNTRQAGSLKLEQCNHLQNENQPAIFAVSAEIYGT